MRHILQSIPDSNDELLPAKKLVSYIRPFRLSIDNKSTDMVDHLIVLLREDDAVRNRFSNYISNLIYSKECLDAFCESGILSGTTFLSGLYRRVVHKMVPELYPDNDLRTAVVKIFTSKSDSNWLKSVSVEKWSELFSLIEIGADEKTYLNEQIANSLVVLSHRVTSLGLEPEISTKLPDIDKLSSPFITQTDEIIKLAQKINAGEFSIENNALDYKQINVLLNQCEYILAGLRDHKNEYGASISLTYILVRLQQHIRRIRLLLMMILKMHLQRCFFTK